MALAYALAVAILSWGCGAPGPTGPSSPQEAAFLDTAQCFANQLELGTVSLTTFDQARPVGTGYVACGAWPGGHVIECWSSWINDPASVRFFGGVAAHEVCHLSGLWDEMDAELCASSLVSKGVCS